MYGPLRNCRSLQEPLFPLATRMHVSSGALFICDMLRKFLADKNAEVDISYRIVLWLFIYLKKLQTNKSIKPFSRNRSYLS